VNLVRITFTAFLTLGSVLLVGTSAAAADGLAASARVRLDGELLSLRVDRVPLTRLVASLNRSGHVAVVVRGGAAQITVSDWFEATDIGQALRRLLSTYSHVLIDRRTAADATRVLEVILLLSPAAPGSEPIAEAIPPVETDEGPAADASPDAPQQPLDLPPTEALLAQQLSDPDEQVRARALETLKDTADDVPLNTLTQVARDDASADRRIQALELLAERVDQKARGPLRLALADPEPAVRKRARELIEDWHLDP
jgi:hypothetical protein